MTFTSPALAFLLALGLSVLPYAPVHAAPASAVIEAVQLPAWVERSGVRQPLALGTVLRPSDRLITGANARILLKMAEGSRVRLGENAQLNLDEIEVEKENEGIFLKSALNVVRGAFRITTDPADAATSLKNRRQINIRLATAKIGVRNADVWGKQEEESEMVCLIDGRADMGRVRADKTAELVTLDQPMSTYVAPTGLPARPVDTVSGEQLAKWAIETDMAAGAGTQSPGGKWQVTFFSSADFRAAFDMRDALRKQGYPVEILPGRVADKRIYQVNLASLASKDDAQTIANRIGSAMKLNPKIGLSANPA